MTDARFPERWLNDRRYMALSGPDFRAFVCTLTWSVASRTDGIIRHSDVDLMAWLTPEIADRLAANNVFVPTDDGWLIDGFAVTQTTRKELEALDAKREADALRKREERAAQKMAASKSPGHPGVLPDVPTDVQRDTPRTRTRTRPLREQVLTQVDARASDEEPPGQCAAPGCPKRPRNRCWTCAEHANQEFTYRKAS